MTFYDWLAKQANLRPNAVALVDTASGRSFTYEEFNLRASRFARFLRKEWGLRPGERVALLAPNSTDYFEILWGCAKADVILVCLNWRLAVPELAFILRDSTPSALITAVEFEDAARELSDLLQFKHQLTIETGYEPALSSTDPEPLTMPPRAYDDIWHILYTSGTTGRPKGVLQTFGMVFYNALNIGLPMELTSRDRTLNLLPFFHTGGLNMLTNPTLHVGGTAYIMRAFDPAQTLKLFSGEITAFFGVPAIYLFLSQHPEFEKTDLSGVRAWCVGGAPMPHPLIETYAARGIAIRQGFGMTETGPTVFVVDKENALTKLGTVGKPQMHVDVRIVGADGKEVPQGERGELLISGPGVTPGYWQAPDLTAEAIQDGWLHSGDVAEADADGYYYIVDRWKDMFISGGENVYPAEIENVLYSLPQISEAAVIGIADERWGEVGKAFIVAVEGANLSEEDVLIFCRKHLARYKVPKVIEFIDMLPRNAAGKVKKTELRK